MAFGGARGLRPTSVARAEDLRRLVGYPTDRQRYAARNPRRRSDRHDHRFISGIGPLELAIVLVIVLLIFGGRSGCPRSGRQLGGGHARVQGLDHRQADDDDEGRRRRSGTPRERHGRAGPSRPARRRRVDGEVVARALLARPPLRRRAPWPRAQADRARGPAVASSSTSTSCARGSSSASLAFVVVLRRLPLAERLPPRHRSTGRSRRPRTRRPRRTQDPLEQSACWQRPSSRVNDRIARHRRRAGALRRPISRSCGAQAEQLSRAAAAARGRHAARQRRERPVTLGRRRAVHGHAHVAAYAALLLVAAAAALPALRVRPARVLADASARSRCR